MARQWRTRRISRRYVYMLGVLLVLLPLMAASQAMADHITLANPPSFTYVSDEACKSPVNLLCPDDQPGQKDLSAHAVASPAPGDLWVSWKWDVTALSGGNTGDACALFDTDADSKVNSALCVTIAGDPADNTNTRVYTCGDAKVDRCTSTAALVPNTHSVCDVSQPASSDPFHSGQRDTVAVCHVYLLDLSVAGSAATLINTCSYPSEQPNSDPSDCVLIPRDAFIQIVKNATPDTAGSFPFKVDGATTGIVFPTSGNNTATGDESSNTIAIKSGTPSHSVQELVPTGWDLTSASCTGASGTGTSNGSLTGDTISGIIAASDNTVICTFNDRQRASVDISKSGSDTGAQTGAVFTLYNGANTSGTVVGTCTVIASGHCDASSAPTTPSFGNLVPGQYTIDETTIPAGYNKPGILPETFMLAAGQAKTLSYTDQAQPGSVTITKVDDAGAVVNGATFQLYSPQGIAGGAPTGNPVAGKSCTTAGSGTCTISNVAPGLYTIDETVVPSGYAKDPNYPRNITVSNGGTLPLNSTNARLFKVIVLVCRQSNNTLYSSGITVDTASAGNSLTSAGATSAGLSESALCGLTAGAKTGLKAAPDASNPHDADISIPNS